MEKESFNKEQSKKNLLKREEIERENNEKERQKLLEKVVSTIKNELSGKGFEVYLVGSITRPYAFNRQSDVDIVVKGYSGDRFDLWTYLEGLIERNIEVILYEKCPFKEELDHLGLKVI